MDWLCLHLDPTDLPRRFAGAAQSRAAAAAGIKVVARADEAAASARRCVDRTLFCPKNEISAHVTGSRSDNNETMEDFIDHGAAPVPGYQVENNLGMRKVIS